MIGMHKLAPEFSVGDRVVTASSRQSGLDGIKRFVTMRVERIKWIDQDAVRLQHNARVTLESPMGERTVAMGRSSFHDDAPMRIVWTDPLPADDGAALALVAGAFMSDDRRNTVILWIAAIADGVAYCHLLTDDMHADDGLTGTGPGMRWSRDAIAVAETEGMAPRRLVVARHRRADEVEGRSIHEIDAVTTILDDVGLAEAACALPVWMPRYRYFASGNFTSMHPLREAEELAYARTQRSEALVLHFMDGDSGITRVLGSTGVAFFNLDSAADYLEGGVPGPGLWMFVDAKMTGYRSYEGEYDADLDGTYRPATRADIEHMVGGLESARQEIRDHADPYDLDMDELIAMAESITEPA